MPPYEFPKREGYVEDEVGVLIRESEVSYERDGTGGADVELVDNVEAAGGERVVILVGGEDTEELASMDM
jgi:hypothetical protein